MKSMSPLLSISYILRKIKSVSWWISKKKIIKRKHLECPGEFLLGTPVTGNVDGQHELPISIKISCEGRRWWLDCLIPPEVNGATVVCVKSPEDVLTESCGIAPWEHLAVHGDELIFGEFSFWTILDESLMPGLARTPVFPRAVVSWRVSPVSPQCWGWCSSPGRPSPPHWGSSCLPCLP